MKDTKVKKVLTLLSGGLDSTLATRLIKDMGFEITALNFNTTFCTCNKKGCQFESKKVANEFKIPLKVMNVTKEYVQVVRNPKFGYGSGMNPCIDCRIFMFKKAKEYMQEVGASFIITGEVLGQRPMSQNRMAMKIIEKESGLEGLILRPLTSNGVNSNSKNILKDIELNKLPNISGRSRKKQLSLAKTLNIENYICGTGGCSLTDKEFIKRLKDYFEYNKENNLDEIKLLKIGRHFRLDNNTKLIVGRNEEENKTLNNYRDMGIFFVPIKRGPNALVIGENVNPAHLKLAGRIIGRYCKDDETEFTYTHKAETKNINLIPFKHEELGSYRI